MHALLVVAYHNQVVVVEEIGLPVCKQFPWDEDAVYNACAGMPVQLEESS